MKNQKGVSLIALVITIIVVIILAAIAFNSSTSTIEKANYSKFVTNIGEVRDAFKVAATTFKGEQAALGNEITDKQAYDVVAKGKAKKVESGDILSNGKVPVYTIIDKDKAKESVGIALPVIKVNTENNTGVEVTYAVTDEGDIFVWPPYKYEGKYYVNDTATLTNTQLDSGVPKQNSEITIGTSTTALKCTPDQLSAASGD